jgi:hypothetical protein
MWPEVAETCLGVGKQYEQYAGVFIYLFTVLVILLNKAFTVRMSSAVGEESLV